MRKRLCFLIKYFIPLLGMIVGNIETSFAQSKTQSETQVQTQSPTPDIGEDPGPVYTDIVLKWAKATNFAQNAAEMIVEKFKLELENNPKYKQAFTPELKSDLEQFFYELFLSPQTMKYLASIYAQYFTLDDMQEMIKFYESPVGQKLIKAEPELQIKIHKIGEILLKEHRNDYLRIIGKHVGARTKK